MLISSLIVHLANISMTRADNALFMRPLTVVLQPAQLELEEVRLQLQEWNDNLQQQMRALRASGRSDEATALTEALSEAAVDPNASWGVIKVGRQPPCLPVGSASMCRHFDRAPRCVFSHTESVSQFCYGFPANKPVDMCPQAAGRADVDILGGKGSANGTSIAVAADRQTATKPARAGAETDKFLGGALRFVQNLHELSVKLVKDADSDRRTFSKSAAAKKVKRAAT